MQLVQQSGNTPELDSSVRAAQLLYSKYAVTMHRIHVFIAIIILIASTLTLLFAPGLFESGDGCGDRWTIAEK